MADLNHLVIGSETYDVVDDTALSLSGNTAAKTGIYTNPSTDSAPGIVNFQFRREETSMLNLFYMDNGRIGLSSVPLVDGSYDWSSQSTLWSIDMTTVNPTTSTDTKTWSYTFTSANTWVYTSNYITVPSGHVYYTRAYCSSTNITAMGFGTSSTPHATYGTRASIMNGGQYTPTWSLQSGTWYFCARCSTTGSVTFTIYITDSVVNEDNTIIS